MASFLRTVTRLRRKGPYILAAVGVYALYALVFVLGYDKLGPGVSALLAVPVMAACWLIGPKAWVPSGIFGVALNGWLYSISDPDGWRCLARWWLGHTLVLFLGYVAAALSRAVATVKEQARQLTVERNALKRQVAEAEHARQQLREVVQSAPCLLWHATVREKEDGNGYVWSIHMHDEEAAQAFLPLHIPPGRTYADAWWFSRPPEDRSEYARLSADALACGKDGYSLEFRTVDATGAERWLFEQVKIYRAGLEEWRIVGVCTDITDRKRAEQQIQELNHQLTQKVAERTVQLETTVVKLQAEVAQRQEAERELRRVLDSARCRIWYATVTQARRDDGRIEYHWELRDSTRDPGQRFLPVQFQPGQTYHEAFRDGIPREDREDMDRRAHHALSSGLSRYSQQFRCRRADGEIRWIYEDVHIEPAASGVWNLVGVCTDITEQRQAEDELARLTLALLHSADAILVADAGFVIEYVNPAFERIVGYAKEEVVGRHISVLNEAVPDWSTFPDDVRDTLANDHVWTGSGQQKRRDGTTYYADATVSAVRDADGKITAYVAAIRDVTERMSLEDQLR
ncbi:MAG: PAS domain S-box protein, partial [Armatimonadota bacterium]